MDKETREFIENKNEIMSLELIATKKEVSDAIARFERSYKDNNNKYDKLDNKLDIIISQQSEYAKNIALNKKDIESNKRDIDGSGKKIEDMSDNLKDLTSKMSWSMFKVGAVISLFIVIAGAIIKFAS